jgi:hypothetical protein
VAPAAGGGEKNVQSGDVWPHVHAQVSPSARRREQVADAMEQLEPKARPRPRDELQRRGAHIRRRGATSWWCAAAVGSTHCACKDPRGDASSVEKSPPVPRNVKTLTRCIERQRGAPETLLGVTVEHSCGTACVQTQKAEHRREGLLVTWWEVTATERVAVHRDHHPPGPGPRTRSQPCS